ncbi:hypothetical protein LTR12_015765 [Friedmanniomyces endolithicus]|nr:hypothetical protein LTR12_015765 [Friedmanniomyces endolithicus]
MATRKSVHVLDDYYLAITLLITVAYQLVGFSIAFSLKFDKLTDFMGGTNFVWLAIITLAMSGTTEARQIVVSIFIMLWAARLSGFLFFRILKTGKDDRFDDKRDRFFPFLGFWVFQMLWVWIVSFPVTILNSPAVLQYPQPKFGQATDIVGTIIFVLGFGLEAVADLQKYLFKQSETGKVPGAVCNVGFFKYSRHPNYFGEIMVQLSPAQYLKAPAPTQHYTAAFLGLFLLTGLLMGLSGLTLQERPGAKKRYEKGIRWPEYEKWLNETSIMFPMPPAIWRNLPVIVKRTVGLEWPIYVFDPAKHADQSKVQERRAEEGEQHLTAADRASDEPERE